MWGGRGGGRGGGGGGGGGEGGGGRGRGGGGGGFLFYTPSTSFLFLVGDVASHWRVASLSPPPPLKINIVYIRQLIFRT